MSAPHELIIMRKIARDVYSAIGVMALARSIQMKNLSQRGLREAMTVVLNTMGFGNIGERSPVTNAQLSAYAQLVWLKRIWIDELKKEVKDEEARKWLEEGEEAFNDLIGLVETQLIARSFTKSTVLGPVAEAASYIVEVLDRLGVQMKPKEEVVEESKEE